jgi:hypothetical protein
MAHRTKKLGDDTKHISHEDPNSVYLKHFSLRQIFHQCKKKVCAKPLHIRLTLTTLPWKRNRSLLSRPLLVTKYWAMNSTWPINPVSREVIFRVWATSEHYFPNDTIYPALFRDMVSITDCNLIKIILAVSRKVVILCLRPIWRAPNFAAGMFRRQLDTHRSIHTYIHTT